MVFCHLPHGPFFCRCSYSVSGFTGSSVLGVYIFLDFTLLLGPLWTCPSSVRCLFLGVAACIGLKYFAMVLLCALCRGRLGLLLLMMDANIWHELETVSLFTGDVGSIFFATFSRASCTALMVASGVSGSVLDFHPSRWCLIAPCLLSNWGRVIVLPGGISTVLHSACCIWVVIIATVIAFIYVYQCVVDVS